MSRLAKGSTTLVSLFALVLISVIAWRVLPSRSPAPVLAQQPGVTLSSTDVQVALLRSNLSAEALTAAGLSSTQAAAVVAAARTDLIAHPTRLSDADTACASARAAADVLGGKIQSGLATEQEVASYAAAQSTLASAISARQAALDANYSAATASLSANQLSVLSAIRANESHKLPIEFLAVNRTDEEWLSLRNALSNERIAAKYGEQANAGCQSLLSNLRANPTVAAAKASSDTNLASVTTSWNTAAIGN